MDRTAVLSSSANDEELRRVAGLIGVAGGLRSPSSVLALVLADLSFPSNLSCEIWSAMSSEGASTSSSFGSVNSLHIGPH